MPEPKVILAVWVAVVCFSSMRRQHREDSLRTGSSWLSSPSLQVLLGVLQSIKKTIAGTNKIKKPWRKLDTRVNDLEGELRLQQIAFIGFIGLLTQVRGVKEVECCHMKENRMLSNGLEWIKNKMSDPIEGQCIPIQSWVCRLQELVGEWARRAVWLGGGKFPIEYNGMSPSQVKDGICSKFTGWWRY